MPDCLQIKDTQNYTSKHVASVYNDRGGDLPPTNYECENEADWKIYEVTAGWQI